MEQNDNREARFVQAERAVRIGLAANCALMLLKLAAGRWGHSEAVFADGIESACDLAISAASLATLRFCRHPFDRRHPYGHGRAESIAALTVSCVIIATGVWILYSAASSVVEGHVARPNVLAVAAAALTIASKEWLARLTFRKARQLGSPVLRALAQDHRKDAITSVATLAGCGVAALGWLVFDPIFAGVTALLIAHVGVVTFRQASHELMDAALPDELLAAISAIAMEVEGIEHVHDIRGRRSGQYVIVDLKVEMDPKMTVERSHELITMVKRRIFDAESSVGDVMIHVNPHDDPRHEDLVRL
ncbi:MAG: cation diffusion facilitator family transporter [Kiritimatiellae bacterium]|nr:cation diffusion facilitator family transporter [Kiritimatiellia bacterium]